MKSPNSPEPVAPGGCENDRTTQYYTVEQVAERYGVCQRVVYEALRSRSMGGFRVGGSWRVSEEALRNFEQKGGFQRPRKNVNRPIGSTSARRRTKRPVVTKIQA